MNFQHAEGTRIIHDLVRSSHVLVENYLPGTLKKYNLDYESIRQINPSIIYASITGYGQTGPYLSRPGYDVMVEAEFGLMHITGEANGPPVKVGVAITDVTTGVFAANSILAALLAKQHNGGQGQWLDISLSNCQTACLANIASSVLISGKRDGGRWGTSHPSIVPYRGFKAKDGDIMIGCGNDKLFGILCDKLGKPEWKRDPRFVTNKDRVHNRDLLESMIADLVSEDTVSGWCARLEDSGMPYAPINDVLDSLNHEHTRARNMVVDVEHSTCGTIKLVDHPVRYSNARVGFRSAPPTLGQHTDEILRDILGKTPQEIAELRSQRVIA